MGLFISWFHNCVLLVKPFTKYYYRIPATAPCVTKFEVHSFMSPLAFGSPNPINISIMGDIENNNDRNNGSTTKIISALVKATSSTNFHLHVGNNFLD
jgi:hypothetical protein